MMFFWFQVREPDQVLNRIVPIGPKLPTFEEFKALLDKSKIVVPADFEQCYFNPCIHAMKSVDHDEWPHCAFNCEGRVMAMHGWGPKILKG